MAPRKQVNETVKFMPLLLLLLMCPTYIIVNLGFHE